MSFQNPDFIDYLSDNRIPPGPSGPAHWSPGFRIFKRSCDLFFSLHAVVFGVPLCCMLLLLNPLLNPGPLFFRQARMGQGGKIFQIWKFRTMMPSNGYTRGHDEALEVDRITRLGRILRQTRLDELPNFINVLRGEMSVIGPRPDMVGHAVAYCETVPRYRHRLQARPGITGLAQVRHGYVEHTSAVCRKARNDSIYIKRASASLDLWIILVTFRVMATGFGAR